MRVPIPENEALRLKAMERYEILDTASEESFDRITRLAKSLYSAPIAHMTIVAEDRVWCKSQIGSPVRETSRHESYAGWAILSDQVMVVKNALKDERFRESVKLTKQFNFQFYAGAPLITPDGYAIGVLAILDSVPRPNFNDDEAKHLRDLAALVVDQLELRSKTLQLRGREADYRDLFENCPIGIYRTSPTGEIIMVNPAILKMLDYSSIEELQSINLNTPGTVDSRDEWKKRLESEGQMLNYESVWYSREGHPLQICETTRVVRNPDGSIAYYEGWAEDISATKVAEAEREKAQLFNQTLIEAVPDLIYIFDIKSERSVFTNRSYPDIIGQDPEYVRQLDNPVGQLVHPDDIPRLRHHRQLFRSTPEGKFLELEFRVRDRDGRYRILSCRETVFSRNPDGSPNELLGVINDISERRSMEERLHRDEERWQLALAANNDGLWDWDARTGTVFHSPRWLEILGFSEGNGSQMDPWEELLHPDDAARVLQRVAAYLKREVPVYQEEYRLRTKDDSYRWVFARGVAQWDEEGNPLRMVGAHTDITKRKEAELALQLQTQELAEARDKARAAAEAKSTFLATMSHEIRTPLNGVLGMTAILSDTGLTSEQHDYVRTIRSSGSALLTVINEILDFSKIEAGQMELDETDFDLAAVVEESVDLLAEKADRKRIELAVRIDRPVPAWIHGDSGRLRQILLNLLSNAVKFTHQGEVILTVTKQETSGSEAVVRFEVSDTGIGIAADMRSRIFSAFSQADASTTRRFGGTGLGLAISKQLVELMGGRIGVESEVGFGSTFWFEVSFELALESSGHLQAERLDGMRIIVADDNATNRKIMQHILEPVGVDVICAADGFEALSALLESEKSGKHVDLALLDFQMPRMDGIMLTRALRAQPVFKRLPIVLLTSITQRDHVEQAKELDIQAYLVKPIRNAQLIQTIRSIIASGRDKSLSPPVSPADISRRPASEHTYKILLAEDNPVNQKVAVLMLTRLGYQVDVVENGREAVEASRSFAYDAILLDCQMPEMDGFDATRLIRQTQKDDFRVPIIALTASALAGERDRCLAAGMDDYLSKPIDQKLLGDRLASLLPTVSRRDKEETGKSKVFSS